jgi:ferredoxin
MVENDVYSEAADKLGYPGSASCIKYLKVLFTPDEGKLLLEFLKPATCAQVAERLGVDEESLQARINDLTRRRLLFHGKTEYVFQFGIHVFFARIPHAKDEYIPAGFWEAWREFHPEEIEKMSSRYSNLPATGIPGSRIVPYRLAIAASPKISPEQVLWYEDMAQIFAREEMIGMVKCPCRKEFHNCDRPRETCFYFGKEAVERDINEYSVMRKLTLEEAIALSDQAEIGGLMHLMGNFAGIPDYVMCHCCECCCVVLSPAIASGRLRQLYSPSRYLAVVDEETCIGCQECVERCFFNAIQMRMTLTSKKKKAHVIKEYCMGCGSCVVGCKQKALTFELVRPPEHIPVRQQGRFTMPAGMGWIREEALK